MLRVLITGANGQVGHELLRALGAGENAPSRFNSNEEACLFPRAGVDARARRDAKLRCEMIPATRDGNLESGDTCEAVDLAEPDGMTQVLNRLLPDVIVNAAAYTAVDRAEDEPELAQRINGDAVGVLGAWAAQHAARLVHYSTDYVFDGTATQPYREADPTHPLGMYGRSKRAGEIALGESGARYLLFRTAWVYATRGHNFLRTMLRLGAEREELRVVGDQIGAPTPARLIANLTVRALAQWYSGDAAPQASLDGIYHLAAGGQTSWCGFARTIFERWNALPSLATVGGPEGPTTAVAASAAPTPAPTFARIYPRAPRITAIRTADYPTRARRPAYSVLDTTKLRETLGVALPDWQTALDGVIAEWA